MSEFIENCWYVTAWEHELTKNGLFARTVCALVQFRRMEDAARVRNA